MDAENVSYQSVLALLASSRVNGTAMEYVFRCPVTGFEAAGSAPIPQFSAPDAPNYVAQIPQGVARVEAQTVTERIASRLVPGGGAILEAAGGLFQFRRGRRAVGHARQSSVDAVAQGEQIQRQLMITAFTGVADQFAWDPAGGRWIKSSA